MPGFDGTGPRGEGPFSGKGMGYCALPLGRNYPNPLNNRPLQYSSYPRGFGVPRGMGGRGLGLGRGMGRGRRFW